MTDNHTILRNCLLCNGDQLENVMSLKASPLADEYLPPGHDKLQLQLKYPLDIFLCGECGHVQLGDIVHPKAIYLEYLYETNSSLGLPQHFLDYQLVVSNVLDRQNKEAFTNLVVDIGSNDGTLLRCFEQKGFKVLGIDPAIKIAQKATENGIETWANFFSFELSQQIVARHSHADVITVNNLMANVVDLQDFAKGLKNLLSSEGVIVIESYYLGQQIENMVFDFFYHEHLSAFSLQPLKKFFAQHNLLLFDAQPIKTKGGSMRYFICHESTSEYTATNRLDKLLKIEGLLGLRDKFTYENFYHRISATKMMLQSVLKRMKATGLSIAAYGASATSTTLVQHYELNEFMDYYVDENVVKQGLLSPLYHKPVFGPEVICEKQPDIILLLAWRYYEPIVKKCRRDQKFKGLFILPLPDVKIIGEFE
jgi:hypothetical protein